MMVRKQPADAAVVVTRWRYGISSVVGDAYAGQTFVCDFQNAGIGYTVSEKTRSQIYEALEPLLNGRAVVLLDVPQLQ